METPLKIVRFGMGQDHVAVPLPAPLPLVGTAVVSSSEAFTSQPVAPKGVSERGKGIPPMSLSEMPRLPKAMVEGGAL